MLIAADVKGLEVVTAAYLSQDETLKAEVVAGVDFHETNRVAFDLPDRVTAKRFMFKLIYGASAWGYAHDNDFVNVSISEKFWQEVIDEFYAKYTGLKQWHIKIVQDASSVGRFISPSGRAYSYPVHDVISRLWFWRPKILNYPVQGLGADLVMLGRISFWNRYRALAMDDHILPVSSVHDSIVVDTLPDLCYTIGRTLKESVEAIPMNFKRVFKVDFNLPLTAEIKCGKDLKNMEKIEC